MINYDVLQCLYETSPDLSLILSTDTLHSLEQVLPDIVNIDFLISSLTDPILILLLLGKLCRVVSYIHEHCNGSKIRVDVFIIWLRKPLDTVEYVHEVLLT